MERRTNSTASPPFRNSSRQRRSGAPAGLSILLLLLAGGVQVAHAVVLMGTGNPDRNTGPPGGELQGSGWQYIGQWGFFLGTVIGPSHFITSGHIGGSIGDPFHYAGRTYTTTACYRLNGPDLWIWEVCGLFPPRYAPLYPSEDEEGQPLVVFGRGTRRGAEVRRDGRLRGWLYGIHDHRQRWGRNRVSATERSGGADYLVADFDRDAGSDEAGLSVGDSGGPVFIRHQGEWKLAGINHGVDGPFSLDGTGNGFRAVLFDARGYYHREEGDWQLVEDGDEDAPAAFYSIRISSYRNSIESVVGGDAMPTLSEPQVVSSPSLSGRFHPEYHQILDRESRTVTVSGGEAQRFYYLKGCFRYRIGKLEREGDLVVLHYRKEP